MCVGLYEDALSFFHFQAENNVYVFMKWIMQTPHWTSVKSFSLLIFCEEVLKFVCVCNIVIYIIYGC